ncbi:MAG: hypothetical protein GY948_22425 [Alphaproteobacteria bacterium]|nr:hypothetical protein [Alphaproteobacteria bacterium]
MPSVLQINALSLLGIFAGLLIGLAGVACISRFAYPGLRQRHEEAKANGTKAAKPSTVLAMAKLVAFFVLPAMGLVIANVLSGTSSS